MTAITVSVGGHSRSLVGTWAVAVGIAAALVLVAAGLVAGRWTAPAASSPAPTVVRYADPGAPSQVDGAEPRCRVRTPC